MNPPLFLSDIEIANFLSRIAREIEQATNVMCDSYGTLRPERIFKAQYLLGKIAGEIERMADRLHENNNILKSTKEYKRMLQREQEYRSDDEYFRRMGNKSLEVETESLPNPASDNEDNKHVS